MVRYLTTPSIQVKWRISWGGKTWRGAKDGNPLNAAIGESLDRSGMYRQGPEPWVGVGLNKQLPEGTPSGGGNNNTSSDTGGGAGWTVVDSVSIFSVEFRIYNHFLLDIRSLSSIFQTRGFISVDFLMTGKRLGRS